MHDMDNILHLNATRELLHDSDFYYIICTGMDGNYSYINNRYARSFSFINSNFVGQPYHITMHPDDTRTCEEVGGKCFANPGKLFPATLRKHNGAGGYIITQWEFVLMEENGQPTGIFCIGFDITEFVEVKKKVNTIRKVLDNKNSLLEAIAFEQSHIVRAPLANILGLVGILKNMDMGVNAATVIKMLDESSQQLDNAIKNIVKKV
jgi:hypothetical protein